VNRDSTIDAGEPLSMSPAQVAIQIARWTMLAALITG